MWPNVDKLVNAMGMIITAGIVSDLKDKYSEYIDEIDELIKTDPSKRNKYLPWAVKQLVKGAKLPDLIGTLDLFHKSVSKGKLEKKDINQYHDLHELEDAVKEIVSKPTKREELSIIKTEGAKKVHEDDDINVIMITEKRACVYYGMQTRWCITMEGTSYFEQYSVANVIFFFVLRKQLREDDYDKVCIVFQRDADNNIIETEFYDAADTQIGESAVRKEIPNVTKGLLRKLESIAAKVPKSPLAKLKSGEATDEDYVKILDTKESSIIEAVIQHIPANDLKRHLDRLVQTIQDL